MNWFLLTIILLVINCTSSYAEQLEILYVNANVGAAAGGHVALKLDNDVFHYQFYPDDRFLLVRESWDYFRLIYNRLRNRTIYGAKTEVSSPVFHQIKNHFLDRLTSQKRDFFTDYVLSEQKSMLTCLRSGSIDLPIPGLGFFSHSAGISHSAVTMKARLNERLGKDYLLEKRKIVTDQLSASLALLQHTNLAADALVRQVLRTGNLQKEKIAYDLIIESRGLSGLALAVDDKTVLSVEERAHLELHLDRRIQVLAHLLESDRINVGDALLIEAARCLALIESLKKNNLVTLDPYPNETSDIQPDLTDPEIHLYLDILLERLTRQRSALLRSAVTGSGIEADYNYLQIENVNGRRAEVERALYQNEPVRLSSIMMLPSHSRNIRVAAPVLSQDALEEALVDTEKELSTVRAANQEKYQYKLISRNCVNELLRTLNGSFAGTQEAREALGTVLDPVKDRIVVPHDFFYQVTIHLHVSRIERYPSRRIGLIEDMGNREESVSLWFREGNTLSTTLYRKRLEDTPFLFFTDNIHWARPVLGIANLLWSTLYGAAGIFTLPADGGDNLHQGLRGMFYSLPELFFFNIRKGTYVHDFLNTGGHEL